MLYANCNIHLFTTLSQECIIQCIMHSDYRHHDNKSGMDISYFCCPIDRIRFIPLLDGLKILLINKKFSILVGGQYFV